MATVTKTDIDVKYVLGTSAQRGTLTAAQKKGMVFFDTTEKSIFMYDDSLTTPDLTRVVGEVKNVSWNNSTSTLTITPFSGEAVTVNLSTGNLSQAINELQTQISTIETKLATIENGAQANKIESVKVNGTALSISSKAVDVKVGGNLASGAGSSLAVNFSAAYNSADKKIYFYNSATAGASSEGAIASIDATEFIKDGMVNNVSFNASTKKLTITFNTDSGKSDIVVDMTSLVDTYTAATNGGLSLANNAFSLKIANDSQGYLYTDATGLHINVSNVNNHAVTSLNGIVGDMVIQGNGGDIDPIIVTTKHADIPNSGSEDDDNCVSLDIDTVAALKKFATEGATSEDVDLLGLSVTTELVDETTRVIVDATPKWYKLS